MSDWAKWLTGAALAAGAATVGIHTEILPQTSTQAVQAKLQRRAETALKRIRVDDWAKVRMDGQTAVLSGEAPDDASLAAARGALRASVWGGGRVMGGVASIDDRAVTILAPRSGPYRWRARLAADRLGLSGAAPSAEAVDRLAGAAAQAARGRAVVAALVVDDDPPSGPWEEAARAAIAALGHLASGEAELAERRLRIEGEAEDQKAADAARAALASLASPYSASVNIKVAPTPPPAAKPPLSPEAVAPEEPPAAPETPPAATPPAETAPLPKPATPAAAPASPGPADLAGSRPEQSEPDLKALAERCQQEAREALQSFPITFETGSAVLQPSAEAALNRVAKALALCPQARLIVEGHTDSAGREAANIELSFTRARAAAERLAALGVSRDRLAYRGFGASRPLASNETADGRRRNRRIDVVVAP